MKHMKHRREEAALERNMKICFSICMLHLCIYIYIISTVKHLSVKSKVKWREEKSVEAKLWNSYASWKLKAICENQWDSMLECSGRLTCSAWRRKWLCYTPDKLWLRLWKPASSCLGHRKIEIDAVEISLTNEELCWRHGAVYTISGEWSDLLMHCYLRSSISV